MAGRLQLRRDELGDLRDRVQVVGVGLVGLDGDLEALLEERHELDGGERVEDAAGDERSRLRQLAGILPGEELLEDELLDR